MTTEEAMSLVRAKYNMNCDCTECNQNHCEDCCEAFQMAIEALEADSVKHGHWISVGMGFDWHYKCSQCGYVDGYAFNDRHKYCPECGARMDKVEL